MEIEHETQQQRAQASVQQLSEEMGELQRSIGLKNVSLHEACQKEEDLLRQVNH